MMADGRNGCLLRLKLVGSLEAIDQTGRSVLPKSRKAVALLTYLSLHPDQWVPRTRLTRLLWNRVGEEQGRASLRQALFELNRSMGPVYGQIFEVERERIRLCGEAVSVDAVILADKDAGADGASFDVFSSNLLLDALDDLTDEFDQWLAIERQRLESRIRGCSETVLIGGGSGDASKEGDQLAAARRAVSMDPTNEHAVRTFMTVLAECGLRAQAVLAYQQCESILRSRLDVEPAPETRRLYLQLKRAGERSEPDGPSRSQSRPSSREAGGILNRGPQVAQQPVVPSTMPSTSPGDTAGVPSRHLVPSVVVLPFATAERAAGCHGWGDVIADEVIRLLSHSQHIDVISRLSAVAARSQAMTLQALRETLGAEYVVSGSVRTASNTIVLDVELADAGSHRIIWTERLEEPLHEALAGDRRLINQTVTSVSRSILQQELRRMQSHSLGTLDDSTLLLAAISLMHRNSLRDFNRARELLEAVASRHVGHALPSAWLANWHVLRVQQGWSDDAQEDAEVALRHSQSASETDPYCSLALTIDGFVHTNLLKQLDVGLHLYDLAIDANPNDPLAWLLRGTLHAFTGDGEVAVENTQRALKLTPLDPHRYYYDSLAATACLSAKQFERALEHANRSLRANRTKTSTLRAKAVAHWNLGQHEEGRAAIRELLSLEPHFSLSRWLSRTPSAGYAIGEDWARAFRELGVPA